MVRQPLCELRSVEMPAASEQQERLVQVLAQAGFVKLVRARRALAARHRNELILTPELETSPTVQLTAVASHPRMKASSFTDLHIDGKLALN